GRSAGLQRIPARAGADGGLHVRCGRRARVPFLPAEAARHAERRLAMNVSRRGFLAGTVGTGIAVTTSEYAHSREAAVPPELVAGELYYLALSGAAAAIRAKKISPVELTNAMLARIDRVEPKVHAFVTLTRDVAVAA